MKNKVFSVKWSLILIILMSMLAACQNTPPAAPQPEPTTAAATEAVAPPSPVAEPADTQGESPLAAPVSPLAPPLDVTIKSGRAAVYGRLLSVATGQPLMNATVRLPEVYCHEEALTQEQKEELCFWALDDAMSPSAQTGSDGEFLFADVEARDYVVMIGNPMTGHTMVENEEQKPIVYSPQADQLLNLGELAVPFP